MVTNSNIYQHFAADEKQFIDRASDLLSQVADQNRVMTTDFVNPREAFIVQTLADQAGLQMFTSAHVAETEYQRLILAPDYYELDDADFELALVEINFPSKFVHLKHSQVLGALLGETGLNRNKFGDIVVTDDNVQVFTEQQLVPSLTQQITKIGRAGVTLKEVPLASFMGSVEKPIEEVLLLSSLRLDKVIAASYKMARSKAVALIEAGHVKVNYVEKTGKDFHLTVSDLVSVRGYGRIKVIDLIGETKKDKKRVQVEIIRIKKR
jgi:RNA-binding protein YlmH